VTKGSVEPSDQNLLDGAIPQTWCAVEGEDGPPSRQAGGGIGGLALIEYLRKARWGDRPSQLEEEDRPHFASSQQLLTSQAFLTDLGAPAEYGCENFLEVILVGKVLHGGDHFAGHLAITVRSEML
jgi:hypothetical protein